MGGANSPLILGSSGCHMLQLAAAGREGGTVVEQGLYADAGARVEDGSRRVLDVNGASCGGRCHKCECKSAVQMVARNLH